jgi:hypothetical protein
MSAPLAIKHARAVRRRLRQPANAVPDRGIDLTRKPELTVVDATPAAPSAEAALPLGIGALLPDYALIYALAFSAPPGPPPGMPPALAIRTIQRAVCQHFGVSLADLMSSSRIQKVVLPRHIAIWLSRRLTPHSLPAIGRHFGHRDHTTILHAVSRIEQLRQPDAAVQARLDDLIAALVPAGVTHVSEGRGK